jgi:hypoxanthine phosphoribosyltransferase
MDKIRLYNKEFTLFKRASEIQAAVAGIADKLNNDLKGEEPVFISILNGAFMFTADLLKRIDTNCQLSFIKVKSYRGAASTGEVTQIIGLEEDITGKTVILLDDIADTGTTLESIVKQVRARNPEQVKIATLLFKPGSFSGNIYPDYVGMEIPNVFIVGYGLDYNHLGRNYDCIYKLTGDLLL